MVEARCLVQYRKSWRAAGPRSVGRAWLLTTALVLAGCAAGPDFHAPAAPAVSAYRPGGLPEATIATQTPTGDAQRFLEGAAVPTQWWTTFGNAELTRRVQQALAHSPSVASAQAALRQARANVAAARGGLFPALDAKLGGLRQNANAAGLGDIGAASIPPFSVYNASVGVSYTLDLFGGVRRGVEAQAALADLQRFQLEGTYLSLAANVATTSMQEASLREQIKATAEIVGIYGQQLDLVRKQHDIGAKSLADVLVARTALASASAQLPALRQTLDRTQTQLAVYLGRFPAESQLAALELDGLSLPGAVPVSLPSVLVRQRPDIRAAEAQLHQATAQLGVASANLFPQVALSASYGSQALNSMALFGAGTEAWSIGLNLLQPLFHGGTLRAQKRAAAAGLDKAAADYRTTVLTAFQNVADVLRALELDAENLNAQAEAEQSAKHSLDLVRIQYKDGAASYLQELDATRQYQLARINLIQARAARLADTAALYAALGGGWQAGAAHAAASPATAPH